MSLKRFFLFIIALLAFAVILDFKGMEQDEGSTFNLIEQCETWINSLHAPGELFR